jgi:hypothetical protein
MRRNFTKGLLAGAMAMAGLGTVGLAQGAAKLDNNAVTVSANSKATTVRKESKGAVKINPMTGGLDMTSPIGHNFGMTPKEYGMRYGNGGSKRSNMNRYSHNAKLKRRKGA